MSTLDNARVAAVLAFMMLVALTGCGGAPTEPENRGRRFLGLEDHTINTVALDWPYLYAGASSGPDLGLFKADVSAGRPEWEDLQLQPVYNVRVLDTGRVLVTSRAGLLRSDDGGHTWQDIPLSTLLCRLPRSLAVDPSDGDVAYIGLSQGVVKTTDGGESWFPVFRPREFGAFEALAHDPEAGGHIFMAGSGMFWDTSRWMGVVYRSEDGGATVEALDTANIQYIADMQYDNEDGVLFVASWNGVYGYYVR